MEDNKNISRSEALAIINNIKDPEVKDFIFCGEQNDDDFLKQKEFLYKYFNNIFILSFMFIYGKFLNWKQRHGSKIVTNQTLRESSNFMRIITTLDKLYYDFNLSYEVIENLLSDIQILLVMENSPIFTQELGIENAFSSSTKFAHFTHLAKIGRYGIGRVEELDYEGSLAQRRTDLIEFLKMMPFIEKLDIDSKSKHGVPHDEIDLQLLPFERLEVINSSNFNIDEFDPNFAFLYNTATKEYYYLESIAEGKDRSSGISYLSLCYVQTGKFGDCNQKYVIVKDKVENSKPLKLESDSEDLIIVEDPSGIAGFKRKIFPNLNAVNKNNFIKDFNAINFRYIRVLSIAISDILNDGGRRFIYQTFGKRPEYKGMFAENVKKGDYLRNETNGENQEESGYDWDVVIATLLIQEGATKLLTLLFKDNGSRFDQLLMNISYRFGSELNVAHLKKIVSDYVEQENIEMNYRTYGNKKGNSLVGNDLANYKRITAKIQAQVLISKLSELTDANNNGDFRTRFPISMKSRIKLIREIGDDDANYVDGYKEKVKILKLIVSQTLRVLYCFYHGLFAYASEKLRFERESILKPLQRDDAISSQRLANKLFDEAILKSSEEMKKIEAYDVKSVMMKVRLFCKECSYVNKQGSYNELLKRMLGRDFLLNYDEISALEYCFDQPIETKRELKNLIVIIEEVFEYLKDGRSSRPPFKYDGVIFPHIAYLDYVSKTSDGYDVIHFSAALAEEKEIDIKVISEYIYKSSRSYLCVPSRTRSNDELKLWIEPIIIDYEHLCIDFIDNKNEE